LTLNRHTTIRTAFSTVDSRRAAPSRKFRLDELPQLLNVLVGRSLIVRAFVAHDQPLDATARLMVRPGITGGHKSMGENSSARKKNALDEWHVRNASFLDPKIIGKTILFMLGAKPSR
jgi:lipopolysaccharide/colanic/teichoic acid biosynthesis glycosyltransferase